MNEVHITTTSISTFMALPDATVVSVDRGLYRHFGFLTEAVPGQERCVISLNPGELGEQLRTESFTAFGRGKSAQIHPQSSQLQASVVLRRARSGNHATYSWPHFNCEHFVCFALGLPLESPQVRSVAAIAAVMTLMVALRRQA